MAERELKKRPTTDREANTVEEEAPATTDRGERLKTETDDLLDEIEEVLENNAEEFVRNYVQKGGE
jgi:ubiquitin-like protein Pup